MKILDKVKTFLSDEDPPNIAIIGYTQAGKSTFVKQLMENKILTPERESTRGMKDHKITIQIDGTDHIFIASDSGGQKIRQKLEWKNSVARASGIVYIIDSSLLFECKYVKSTELNTLDTYSNIVEKCQDKKTEDGLVICGCVVNQNFSGSRLAKSLAYSILSKGKPILVLFNKVDLKETQPIHTCEDLMKLYTIGHEDYNEHILESSALVGTNVKEGIIWLIKEIQQRGDHY